MKTFETLAQYAKEKITATPIPTDLYRRTELRRQGIDAFFTAALITTIIFVSTIQFSKAAHITSPAAREYRQANSEVQQ